MLDEELAFRLEEEVESRERPLTLEQKKHLEIYGSYDRKVDYLPMGRLRLRISEGGYEGERKSWGLFRTSRKPDDLFLLPKLKGALQRPPNSDDHLDACAVGFSRIWTKSNPSD